MEQIPHREDNSPSDNQKILLLGNPKFHYRVKSSPPRVPKLGQMNPLTILSYFFNMHAIYAQIFHLVSSGFRTKNSPTPSEENRLKALISE
jgi:hypothetical protein